MTPCLRSKTFECSSTQCQTSRRWMRRSVTGRRVKPKSTLTLSILTWFPQMHWTPSWQRREDSLLQDRRPPIPPVMLNFPKCISKTYYLKRIINFPSKIKHPCILTILPLSQILQLLPTGLLKINLLLFFLSKRIKISIINTSTFYPLMLSWLSRTDASWCQMNIETVTWAGSSKSLALFLKSWQKGIWSRCCWDFTICTTTRGATKTWPHRPSSTTSMETCLSTWLTPQ